MKIREVMEILDAVMLTSPGDGEEEVCSAFGADLMSDVLAFSNNRTMLLTGLINPQSVRTAEMMDMRVVVYVRGKMPTPELIALAEEKDMTLMATRYNMYEACGRLYERGLK